MFLEKPSVDNKKKKKQLFYDCELLPDTRRYSDVHMLNNEKILLTTLISTAFSNEKEN